MKITKLEHSGLLVENNGAFLVCDPVEIEQQLPAFSNVKAIVITHVHGDHFNPAIVDRIRSGNPDVKIFTTEENAANIPSSVAVTDGDLVNVEGFDLKFFGKDHASIIPGQVPCQNIGVVINGTIANPGDSFDMPPEKVELLCVPISGPWCKAFESIEYFKNVVPKAAIAFHDAILSEFGKGISNNWLKRTAEELGADYRALTPGESMEI
ncbi:MAG: MBL fold metallo-hydrolase [Candidatus Saccharibacteria bacterium]|nr:MBL fold metallo-hydrolase [Candidatus Saccharibacteria bacterium]